MLLAIKLNKSSQLSVKLRKIQIYKNNRRCRIPVQGYNLQLHASDGEYFTNAFTDYTDRQLKLENFKNIGDK